MKKKIPGSIWKKTEFGGRLFYLLDLDHPEIEKKIIGEIESGIDVYYDRRWELTQGFCEFLFEIPELFINRDILIAGAGIGAESVVIGSMARKLYINDLAPVALDYCAMQLDKNGITDFEMLPGRYESIPIPDVDLTVGCFCVYNKESRLGMQSFFEKSRSPLLLVNDPLSDFKKLLKDMEAEGKPLVSDERFPCFLFEK